jgi:hypothetical protein
MKMPFSLATESTSELFQAGHQAPSSEPAPANGAPAAFAPVSLSRRTVVTTLAAVLVPAAGTAGGVADGHRTAVDGYQDAELLELGRRYSELTPGRGGGSASC